MSTSETTTWVDEPGNVHALVTIPTKFDRLSEDELRKARRRAIYAIRRELRDRGWLLTGYRVRAHMVEPVASIALAVEFVERAVGE